MTALNQNFTMFAGDSKTVTITVSDVDLSGASIKWGVKKTIYDDGFAIYKSTDNAGITISGPDTASFTLIPDDTADLSGDYYHEAEVTDAAGNVSTILTGKMRVELSGI